MFGIWKKVPESDSRSVDEGTGKRCSERRESAGKLCSQCEYVRDTAAERLSLEPELAMVMGNKQHTGAAGRTQHVHLHRKHDKRHRFLFHDRGGK